MSSDRSTSGDESGDRHPLEDDPEFWYLLDIDYDEVESEHTPKDPLIGDLLREFSKRKTSIIEENYTAVSNFVRIISEADEAESKERLLRIYAKYQWENKQKEDRFESTTSVDDILEQLESTGRVIRNPIDSRWEILWPGNDEIDKEVRGGEVRASKETKADSVIVKKADSSLNIRGHSRVRNLVTTNLSDIDEVSEVEPTKVDEQVSEQFSRSLTSENDQFEVIGITYNRSILPKKSGIRIDNTRNISEDIEFLEGTRAIPGDGMSEISEIKVRDIVFGGRYTVDISHHNDGFLFESKTTKKSDERRRRFERRFSMVTGVEFDKIYKYGSQDPRHLLNRILSEDGEAYDNYFEELDPDIRELISEFVTAEPKEYKLCKECGDDSELDSDTCDNCGESDFTSPQTKTIVYVDNDQVASQFYKELKDISLESEFEIPRFETQTMELSGHRVIEADIKIFIEPQDEDTTIRRQVYFVPQGNEIKLRRLSDYLLEGVYIQYGTSKDRANQGFGSIDLFEFFWGDGENGRLVGRAIEEAISGIRQRVNSEAREAHNNAKQYLDFVEGIEEISEHEAEVSDYYSGPNFFEKHVFYLLKGLFPYSERWGKEGKRESDGAIIVPKPGDGTFDVISYDAKLSTKDSGYDLTSGEHDKAVRYIIDGETWDRLQVKTGDSGLTAHVLISQNFDQSQFENMAKHVRYNIERVQGKGTDFDSKLAFVDFESIVRLFSFVDSNWIHFSDPSIRRALHDQILNNISSQSESKLYAHITTDTTAQICDRLVDRIDSKSGGELLPYSEIGRD